MFSHGMRFQWRTDNRLVISVAFDIVRIVVQNMVSLEWKQKGPDDIYREILRCKLWTWLLRGIQLHQTIVMLALLLGIISTALLRNVCCQSILPSAQLLVQQDAGYWMINNTSQEIKSLTNFDRVPGVSENSELALEVFPGRSAVLYRFSDGECIANVIWCPDGQITVTFWVKVLEWKESGAQSIIKIGSINSETSFVVITTGTQPLRVFFNGENKDYTYYVDRELVEEWTFFAAVIDVNNRSMKVYLNGTQLPDSELEVSDNERDKRARFLFLGSSSQVPDYLFGSFKVFYTALSQEELENMYTSDAYGTASVSDNTTTGGQTTVQVATTTMLDEEKVTTTEKATPVPGEEETTRSSSTASLPADVSSTASASKNTAKSAEAVTTMPQQSEGVTTTVTLPATTTGEITKLPGEDETIQAFSMALLPDRSVCELQENIIKEALIGWPTSISCDNVINALRTRWTAGETVPEKATCSVVDATSNDTLYSEEFDTNGGFIFLKYGYLTPDLTWNSTIVYHVFVQANSTCLYDVVTLNLTANVEKTCNQSLNPSEQISISAGEGDMRYLLCKSHTEPKIHLKEGIHNYTTTWYKNCSVLSDSTHYRISGSGLVIISPEFNQAGIYSCSINYKGSEIFAAQFNFCLKPSSHFSEPSLRCPSSVSAVEGESASITCQVDIGFTVLSLTYSALWQQVGKNDSYGCSDWLTAESHVGWNGRAECFSKLSKAEEHNKRCFSYVPSISEQQTMRNVFEITLKFKKIQASDFGSYLAIINHLSTGQNQTITLVKDQSRVETNYIYIIIALSVVVALVLLACFIACCFRCTKRRSRKA